MVSYSARPGRAYSVDTATAGSAYHSNRQQHKYSNEHASYQKEHTRFTAIDEDLPETYSGTPQQEHDDKLLQTDLLQRYNCQSYKLSVFDNEAKLAVWKERGSKVMIKRTFRSSLQAADEVDREINILATVTDPAMPLLVESLELKDVIWTVKEYRPLQTVGELVKLNGPMTDEVLRTALNQLFSGIASLFMGGFAHLRITDQTVCFDSNQALMITDFQYACEYAKQKDGDLYAATQEKYGNDIYVAPEVFGSYTYNARKAVMWSCGVLVYFMTTGQVEKLSSLNHPSLETSTSPTSPFTPLSSASSSSTPSSPLSPTHRRRTSTATTLIHYPGSARFEIPTYARWIIPKMLVVDPTRRAELIEIASRIPKEFSTKATRPLMETAWLDYKTHVGPNAGLDLSGFSAGVAWGGSSSASNIHSRASAISNPFRSLLGRGDRRRSVAVAR